MRGWSAILFGLLLSVLGLVQGLSSSGSRLLVLSDEPDADKAKYSKFLGDLKDRGFAISYASPKDQPQLFHLGARAYDHLFILPSNLKALGPTLTPQTILQFAQDEGNILLALSADTPTPTSLVSALLELDIHLPTARESLVVDHFHYDAASAADKHDVLLLSPPAPKRSDVKDYFSVGDGLVAFPRAVGQTLGADSPLLSSVVAAPPTAYSYDPKDEADGVDDPFAAGAQLHLVSAMQARNSARVTVLGSADALADAWLDARVQQPGKGATKAPAANRAFAAQLAGWTFKELGVLRVGKLQHYLNESFAEWGSESGSVGDLVATAADPNPKIYRIRNIVTYTIELSEYTWTHLSPYTPPATDEIQLEFSMLSPYQRLSLTPRSASANSTTFAATLALPDQHGIFNFRVNYKRPFLSAVDEKRTVTVRHFAHDEWPRSFAIVGAYPWIIGVAVTVCGWLAFVAVWLYGAPAEAEMRGPRGKKVD